MPFLKELVESLVDSYRLWFAKYKDKVAQAFSELDSSNIIDIELEEEGDADEAADTAKEAKVVGTKEVVAKAIADAEEARAEAIIRASRTNPT